MWEEHLPLGKKTGDPFKDLTLILPSTIDGKVSLFEGEVNLKTTPDAKPVQLPPHTVPLSVMPKIKGELDRMEKEGIIRPCPEPTDWVWTHCLFRNILRTNGYSFGGIPGTFFVQGSTEEKYDYTPS